MKRRLLILSSLFVPVFVSLAGLAQSSQDAKQSDSATGSKDLTRIFFTVKDKDNHNTLVPNLQKESFQLLEDGRSQTIKEFASPASQPLTVGVLLDSSGAMQGALSVEKGAAAEFLRQLLGEKDLAFAISFDLTVDLLQDLTSDVHMLREGLDHAHINARGGGSGRGRILLHDAVYLAADEVLRTQVGRKALVIFTSGIDFGSKVKLAEAIEAAQKADATCYVILFGRSILGARIDDVTEATGGRMFTVNSSEKLTEALTQISRELRSQYYIGYVSDSSAPNSSFRKLEISSKEGHKVQVRKGYYAR